MDTPHSASSHLPHHGYRRPVVADWRELIEGDSVILLSTQSSDAPVTGTVDAVAADGSLIWLVQDGSASRRMFHCVDGYKTLLEPTTAEPINSAARDPPPATGPGVLGLGGQL
jgi:hypothetical protein